MSNDFLIINIIMYKPFELSYSISFSQSPSTSSININISALNDVSKIKLQNQKNNLIRMF